MELTTTLAGHELPMSIVIVDGLRILFLGPHRIYEGEDGCFVRAISTTASGDDQTELPLSLTSARLWRELEILGAVRGLLGQPARETCRRLLDRARRA
jgi:hypothetical protein